MTKSFFGPTFIYFTNKHHMHHINKIEKNNTKNSQKPFEQTKDGQNTCSIAFMNQSFNHLTFLNILHMRNAYVCTVDKC